MRTVLDTNVLVSAFISKHGQCAKILDLISLFEEIQLVLSEPILDEFRNVLSREEVKVRFNYSPADIESFIQAIKDISVIIKPKSSFKVIKEDSKDDVILNTAYYGKAEYMLQETVICRI